jgi:hypothetical protein
VLIFVDLWEIWANGIQSNYVLSLYSHNINNLTDKDTPSFSSALELAGENIFNAFSDVTSDFIQRVPELILNSNLMEALQDPQALLQDGIEILLHAAKFLVDESLQLATRLVGALVHLIDSLIDAVYDLCSTRIVIPYLTDFYEQTIMKGNGRQLTIFSLMSLSAALPLTVVWKISSAVDDPVFTPQQHDDFLKLTGDQFNWISLPQVLGRSATLIDEQRIIDKDTATKIGIVMGYVNCVATAVWGITSRYGDSLWVPKAVTGNEFIENPKFLKPASYFLIGSEALYFVSAFPWSTDFENQADQLAFAMWASQIIPTGSNVASVISSEWSEFGDPLLTGSYGIFYLILTTALWCTRDYKTNKDSKISNIEEGMNNILGALTWLPQLAKFARVIPEPNLRLIIILSIPYLDGITYGLAALYIFARTSADWGIYAHQSHPALVQS